MKIRYSIFALIITITACNIHHKEKNVALFHASHLFKSSEYWQSVYVKIEFEDELINSEGTKFKTISINRFGDKKETKFSIKCPEIEGKYEFSYPFNWVVYEGHGENQIKHIFSDSLTALTNINSEMPLFQGAEVGCVKIAEHNWQKINKFKGKHDIWIANNSDYAINGAIKVIYTSDRSIKVEDCVIKFIQKIPANKTTKISIIAPIQNSEIITKSSVQFDSIHYFK
ncbi:MAG: hypothetical protein Q7J16_12150 [Candidatus Cloacimonadales bacterium]|nr:hypothetical protein [Candidatus Cloacimonadales bacterium]